MTALQDQDCVCVCGGRVCLVGKVSNTNTKVRNKVAQGELPLCERNSATLAGNIYYKIAR